MGYPSVDVLHAGDDVRRSKSAFRWLLAGGAAVLAVVVVGGVALAARALYGGGAQPEDALPSGAVAFVKLDLDPAAAQKVNAIRFARNFPEPRKEISEDGDLRKELFHAIADDAGWQSLNYAKHVEPWLGERVGAAVYAPAKRGATAGGDGPTPDVVIALQVKDEDAARNGLARLVKTSKGDPASYVVSDGYALITDSASAARRVGARKDRVLADDEKFAADTKSLGDGVAAGWADIDAFVRVLTENAVPGADAQARLQAAVGGSGRGSFILHFAGPDVLEVKGQVVDADVSVKNPHALKGFRELPAGSLAAFGFADGDQIVTQIFEHVQKAAKTSGEGESFDEGVHAVEQQLDVNLPGDLGVLFGSNFVASFDSYPSGEELPDVGVRITTDTARANALLDKVEKAAAEAGEGLPIVRRDTANGIVIASTDREADRLAASGRLGEKKQFRQALPDVETANVALWVDLAALVTQEAARTGGPVDENLKPMSGAGFTVTSTGEGNSSFRARLVVH